MEAFGIIGMTFGILGMGLGAIAFTRLQALERHLREKGILGDDYK